METPQAPLTLRDLAREAGVSVATLDRVLHGRGGVRADTATRVREAIARYDFRPSAAGADLAKSRPSRFVFVMPKGANIFMQMIQDNVRALAGWLAARRVRADIVLTDVFNPRALTHTLESLSGRYDGVAVVALDHQSVRAAIDDLVASGVHVVTLVSDVPSSKRHHYVGVDNIAAGRTAGSLVGRLIGGGEKKIGVVMGSQLLRDHAERLFGFQQVLALEHAGHAVLPPVEGEDEDEANEVLTTRLLNDHPDLAAIYNVGAGAQGVIDAILNAERETDLVFVAHEVTEFSRRGLLRGVIDAVVAQDPGHEARSALRVLMALKRKEAILADQERIRIEIVMRDNLQ